VDTEIVVSTGFFTFLMSVSDRFQEYPETFALGRSKL